MKIDWGKGIFVVYAVFMVIVLGTVAFTTTVDIDLVADDYYEQELQYQNEIDKKERTNSLSEAVEIILKKDYLEFSYPKNLFSPITGKINFYRPSNKELDFGLNILSDSTNTQTVRLNNLEKGLWKIKVDWVYLNEEYQNEKIIVIN